jgi:hypothetical protein
MVRDLKIRILDEAHCIATWRQTILTIWRGAVTLPAAKQQSEICRTLYTDRNANTLLAVIEATSPPPEGPVRRELANWSSELAVNLKSVVAVAEGGNMRSAIVRSVGLALSIMFPHKVPFKFVSRVEDGVRFLVPHIAAEDGKDALLDAIAKLRQELSTR